MALKPDMEQPIADAKLCEGDGRRRVTEVRKWGAHRRLKVAGRDLLQDFTTLERDVVDIATMAIRVVQEDTSDDYHVARVMNSSIADPESLDRRRW